MEQAEYLRLTRLSQEDHQDDPSGLRRALAGFALLGHVVCLALAVVVLGLFWVAATGTPMRLGSIPRVGAGLVGLLIFAHGAWILIERGSNSREQLRDRVRGHVVTDLEAPQLFEALTRIHRRAGGPAIDAVMVNAGFEVTLHQTRRFGLFGRSRQVLVIGLALMMSLDKPQFFTVLAHECAHLRRGTGSFSAWIHRCHLAWQGLCERALAAKGLSAVGLNQFLKWYLPRFFAKGFAIRRAESFEADAVAAGLITPGLAASALMEMRIKRDWLRMAFWPEHWRLAIGQSEPAGPFRAMATALVQAVDPEFARVSLKSHWADEPSETDPVPSLRERVEAMLPDSLGVPQVKDWPAQSAVRLFNKPKVWLDRFDGLWRVEYAAAWREAHRRFNAARERCDELAALKTRANADELVEWGALTVRIAPSLPVRALFELALSKAVDHPRALMGLSKRHTELSPHERYVHLCKLYEVSAAHRWWAANQITTLLEVNVDLAASMTSHAKTWRMKLRSARVTQERALEEIGEGDISDQTTRHDLSEFELSELRHELLCLPQVVQLWVACKVVAGFSSRRTYAAVVVLRDVGSDQSSDFLFDLMDQLNMPGPTRIVRQSAASPKPNAPFVCVHDLINSAA